MASTALAGELEEVTLPFCKNSNKCDCITAACNYCQRKEWGTVGWGIIKPISAAAASLPSDPAFGSADRAGCGTGWISGWHRQQPHQEILCDSVEMETKENTTRYSSEVTRKSIRASQPVRKGNPGLRSALHFVTGFPLCWAFWVSGKEIRPLQEPGQGWEEFRPTKPPVFLVHLGWVYSKSRRWNVWRVCVCRLWKACEGNWLALRVMKDQRLRKSLAATKGEPRAWSGRQRATAAYPEPHGCSAAPGSSRCPAGLDEGRLGKTSGQ